MKSQPQTAARGRYAVKEEFTMELKIGGVKIPTTPKEVQNAIGDALKLGAREANKLTGTDTFKVPGAATKEQVRTAADAYLSKITGGKIVNVGQLAQFAGNNQATKKLCDQMNKYLSSGTNSLGITDYKRLLTPVESQRLVRTNFGSAASTSPKPSPLTVPGSVQGGVNVYKSVATDVNKMTRSPILPLISGETVQQVRAGADAFLSKASAGKLTSVGQLAHFDGGNQAANKLRGLLNSYLKASSNKVGVADYKSLLTPAEQHQLSTVNAKPAQKYAPAVQPAIEGKPFLNQIGDGILGAGQDTLGAVYAGTQKNARQLKDAFIGFTGDRNAQEEAWRRFDERWTPGSVTNNPRDLVKMPIQWYPGETPPVVPAKMTPASAVSDLASMVFGSNSVQALKNGNYGQAAIGAIGNLAAMRVISVGGKGGKGGKPALNASSVPTANLKTNTAARMPVVQTPARTTTRQASGAGFGATNLTPATKVNTSPKPPPANAAANTPSTSRVAPKTGTSPAKPTSPVVRRIDSAAQLLGGKSNIVNFGPNRLGPGSEWPGTTTAGASKSTGSGRPGSNGTIAKPQGSTQTSAGNVATVAAPHSQTAVQTVNKNSRAPQTNGAQAQLKPQVPTPQNVLKPVVLQTPSSLKPRRAPGDDSPTMPTAPGTVNPITSPGLPRTGDQPGKGSETPLTPDEKKKLADSLARQGKPMLEQKLNNYREGKATREETLAGTAGEQRAALSRVLEGIDRAKMGSGGAFGGLGGSYSIAQVQDIWRQVDAKGGVYALPEDQVRQLTGMTQQVLKEPNLSAAERGDLQSKLASAKQAQQQFHQARMRPADLAEIAPTDKVPRRSKAQRVLDFGRKGLAERFDGRNVVAKFVTSNQFDTGPKQTIPAQDNDRLIGSSSVTVGDVKQLLGGLNNSTVVITREPFEPIVKVDVNSEGFERILLTLNMSPTGISEITIDEISTTGKSATHQDRLANLVENAEPNPRRLLLGSLLALKIARYAELNDIGQVKATAAFGREERGSKYRSYQGAQFWINLGLDGPIGTVGEARLEELIKAHPEIKHGIDIQTVTNDTKISDLLMNSNGELIPERIKLWRKGPIEYRGSFDLQNEDSKSYKLYQRALREFGLVTDQTPGN